MTAGNGCDIGSEEFLQRNALARRRRVMVGDLAGDATWQPESESHFK